MNLDRLIAGRVEALIRTGVARQSQDYQILDSAPAPDYTKLDSPQLVGLACTLLVRADVYSENRSNIPTEEIIALAAAQGIIGELRQRGLEKAVAEYMAFKQAGKASARHPLTWEGYF